MWARSQMNEWSQEAKIEERKKRRASHSHIPDNARDIAATTTQSISSSTPTLTDSNLWLMQKVETTRKISGVLSSILSGSEK